MIPSWNNSLYPIWTQYLLSTFGFEIGKNILSFPTNLEIMFILFFPNCQFLPNVHPFLQIMVSSTHVSFTLAIIHSFLQTMVCSIHVCFSLTTSLLELLQHRVARVFEIIRNVENFVITFTKGFHDSNPKKLESC